jgi:hypothetical protein
MKITIIKPKTTITLKILTNNLVYPPPADQRRNHFKAFPRLCTHKLKMSNEPNLHNFFTISLHFLTSPSSGQGNPHESRRLLNMPNKPNFKTTRRTVTLDMIRTYNENQTKKHKKNKPKTHQKQTKTNQIEPISAQKQPPQTQFHNLALHFTSRLTSPAVTANVWSCI